MNAKMFFMTGIFIFLFSFVSSASIGISPAVVSFEDILRGGYAERIVTITIDSEEQTDVELSFIGEISEWISVNETKFKVSRDKPYSLKIILQPPSDIPNGDYSGFINIVTSGASNSGGGATASVNAALNLNVQVKITDVEFNLCQAGSFNVESAEIGDDVVFKVNVLNGGNVRLYPTIKIDIWNLDRTEIIKQEEFSDEMIIPTTEKEIVVKVNSADMEIGQYWAEVTSLECYASETLTFDVLEIGALKALGKLLSVTSIPWISVGDTTLIEASFENNGEKAVSARFDGEITLGGKIIQILKNENIDVEIGETETFKFYFTPKEIGKYIVNGYVIYDGKRTFEKSTVINVKKKGFSWEDAGIILIYAILILAIAFLAYKINKEKKRRK